MCMFFPWFARTPRALPLNGLSVGDLPAHIFSIVCGNYLAFVRFYLHVYSLHALATHSLHISQKTSAGCPWHSGKQIPFLVLQRELCYVCFFSTRPTSTFLLMSVLCVLPVLSTRAHQIWTQFFFMCTFSPVDSICTAMYMNVRASYPWFILLVYFIPVRCAHSNYACTTHASIFNNVYYSSTASYMLSHLVLYLSGLVLVLFSTMLLKRWSSLNLRAPICCSHP